MMNNKKPVIKRTDSKTFSSENQYRPNTPSVTPNVELRHSPKQHSPKQNTPTFDTNKLLEKNKEHKIIKSPQHTPQHTTPRAATHEPVKYTDERIRAILAEGYLKVHPSLWDHMPTGTHVRYFKKNASGSTLPKCERYRSGGFIRCHFTTDDNKKMIMIESKPFGRAGDAGYVSFPLAYDDIEELWKKYDKAAFIEIHLIHNSLAQKKQQIDELSQRVAVLEDILRSLVK